MGPRLREVQVGVDVGRIFSVADQNFYIDAQYAYAIVQRNAMASWRERRSFRELLDADADVTSRLSPAELNKLFDYQFYLANIGATFTRLGL